MGFSVRQWGVTFVLDVLVKGLCFVALFFPYSIAAPLPSFLLGFLLSVFHFVFLFLGFTCVLAFELVGFKLRAAPSFWLALLFANVLFAGGVTFSNGAVVASIFVIMNLVSVLIVLVGSSASRRISMPAVRSEERITTVAEGQMLNWIWEARRLRTTKRLRARRLGKLVGPLVASFLSVPAMAGDYSVTHAFDGREGIENGKTECAFREYCRIEYEKAGVSLLLGFRNADHTSIGISVSGIRRSSCCFFYDGVSSVSRAVGKSSVIRLHVYEGHRRKGNEFVQNSPIGVLYLQISDVK